MDIVWAVLGTLAVVAQLAGMVWSWRTTRGFNNSRWKRMVLALAWPVLYLVLRFGVVQ